MNVEHHNTNAPQMEASVLELIRAEREKALSAREWKFRLRGFGYGVAERDGGQVLTRLRGGETLGMLPADMV